jgi:hypothetical protein
MAGRATERQKAQYLAGLDPVGSRQVASLITEHEGHHHVDLTPTAQDCPRRERRADDVQ